MSPPQGPPVASPIEGVRVFALCFPGVETGPGEAVDPEDVAWLGTEIEDLEALAYHRGSDGRVVVRTFASATSALTAPGMDDDLRLVWVTPAAPGSTTEGQRRDAPRGDWHCPS